MPYSVLVNEAHKIIDEVPREKLEQVIVVLRGMRSLLGEAWQVRQQVSDQEQLRHRIMSYVGVIPSDIDEGAVLREARDEKYGRIA